MGLTLPQYLEDLVVAYQSNVPQTYSTTYDERRSGKDCSNLWDNLLVNTLKNRKLAAPKRNLKAKVFTSV